jgi:hypothetical protein
MASVRHWIPSRKSDRSSTISTDLFEHFSFAGGQSTRPGPWLPVRAQPLTPPLLLFNLRGLGDISMEHTVLVGGKTITISVDQTAPEQRRVSLDLGPKPHLGRCQVAGEDRARKPYGKTSGMID